MAKTFVGMMRKKYRKKDETFGEFSLEDVKQPSRFTARDTEAYSKTGKSKKKIDYFTPLNTLKPIGTPKNITREQAESADPSVLVQVFGSAQLRTALGAFKMDALQKEVSSIQSRHPKTKPKETSKEAYIDYLELYTYKDHGWYGPEDTQTRARLTRLQRETEAYSKKAEKKLPTRQRKTASQIIAEDDLVPIKQGIQHDFNPLEPPDPLFLRELYGDEQLYKALNRNTTARLKETVKKYNIPVKRGASREEMLEAIVDWAEAGGPDAAS